MDPPLSLGYSGCPNDTFIFHALVHGLVPAEGLSFSAATADVEQLNQAAGRGEPAVTKLSFAALGFLQKTYGLLRTGAALGRGCGPLVVARTDFDPRRLGQSPVAVPGLWTTARLLLGLHLSRDVPVVPMPFERIMPAVVRGEVSAGVIIHEGRFTYGGYGLVRLVDLGRWWEERTGLPIPLGGIAVRRDLGAETAEKVERAVGRSVRYALDHPGAADAYVREHAQEMETSVIRRHIDLYVNDFSIDIGREGLAAVEALYARGREAEILPPGEGPILATGANRDQAAGNGEEPHGKAT